MNTNMTIYVVCKCDIGDDYQQDLYAYSDRSKAEIELSRLQNINDGWFYMIKEIGLRMS